LNIFGNCTVHISPREALSDGYIKRHYKVLNDKVTLMNERKQITRRHSQNVISIRVLYNFVNFNSTLFICLKFAFIEMLTVA